METHQHILILTQCFPPTVGGIENLVGGLAGVLADSGAQVTVFADAHTQADDRAATYFVRRFGGIKFLRRRYKAAVADNALRAGGISQVYCDTWKSAEYLSLSSPSVSLTVLAHGTEYPVSPSSGKKQRITGALAKARRILAVSSATRERMRHSGIEPARVQIWHPPIETPPPATDAARAKIAALWGNAAPRLVSVGRLAERKGLDTAIHAVAGISEQFPDLRYIIAGTGAESVALHTLVTNCRLHEQVQFIGAVGEAEKSALYESADILLLPARPVGDDVEGFGMVFLEAGYFGVPSVAGRCGGAAEAVEDGVTGLHCDGADVDSVRQALTGLLANGELRRQLGENARQKAKANLWAARIGDMVV